MMKYKILSIFIFLNGVWGIDKVLYPEQEFQNEAPWLTGPLFAPSSVTLPPGHFNIEPYLSSTAILGIYDEKGKAVSAKTFWTNQCETSIQVGLLSWLDMQFTPTFFWNYSQNAGCSGIGDLPIILDIQLYNNQFYPNHWFPSVKLSITETCPLGRYDHLNPKKKGTQAGGGGSWVTQPALTFGKLFHLKGVHFLNSRFSLGYAFPAPVRVKGLSVYGGALDTKVRYFPRQYFFMDLAFELTLSQMYAFAIDLIGFWYQKAHFSGHSGIASDGTPANLIHRSGYQYTIAPALEFNPSENLGVIGGVWFSLAGKSAARLISGIVALNYYH